MVTRIAFDRCIIICKLIMSTYGVLWQVMKEKGVTQYMLIKNYRVSAGQLTRLRRNESVSTHTIEVFCKILDCQPGDLMAYIPEEE